MRTTGVRPARLDVVADMERPGLLVLQVKYRPRLFQASVGGTAVATERVDGVWTGVSLPRGASHVVLEARLPAPLWWAAGAALAAIFALAAWRRPT